MSCPLDLQQQRYKDRFMKNSDLICSVSHALLGRITPNLRAVYITLEDEMAVLSFYYDKKPTEDEVELASLADTDFISDFPDDFKSDFRVNTAPYPTAIPNKGFCIYHRAEIGYSDPSRKKN
jgi:hypothetical protein